MKADKAKRSSKESSTARDKSFPKPPVENSTRKEQDLATVTTSGKDPMTTNQGQPISTDQNSLRAGQRGPTLMEDQVLREKIQHFDHERIPERVVHARGAAAHGFFQVYDDSLSKYTTANVLTNPELITPVFVRFSTVAGSRGSADTARDVHGFAVKMYTQEGNWDLVGNNIPVFFIQDAIKFPDLIHAVKPEPNNEIPQASSAHDTFYDFISLTPESMHMLMWIMSDRAIPRSFSMMEGFGVHSYRLINAKGQSHFVKFHWKPNLGVHSLVWDEAVNFHEIPINRPVCPISSNQRDAHMRITINQGRVSYAPSSLDGHSMEEVGPKPGFVSYPEQVSGLKNRERSTSFGDHYGQATLFWNSQTAVEKQHIVKALQFELSKVETRKVRQRMLGHLEKINNVLAAEVAKGIGEKTGASASTSDSNPLPGTSDALSELELLEKATTPTTASGGLLKTKGLSMEKDQPKLKKGRKVAILVAAGVAVEEVGKMQRALKKENILSEIVGPHVGEIEGESGVTEATKTFANSGSVLFDAVYVPGGENSIERLKEIPDALRFIDEAYKHGKAIAASGRGVDLVKETKTGELVTKDGATEQGVLFAGNADGLIADFIEAISHHRFHNREVDQIMA